jgi:hypothetical protein
MKYLQDTIFNLLLNPLKKHNRSLKVAVQGPDLMVHPSYTHKYILNPPRNENDKTKFACYASVCHVFWVIVVFVVVVVFSLYLL